MSIDRRGFLGGLVAAFAAPKNLITKRAGGFVPSARLISGKALLPASYVRGGVIASSDSVPMLLNSGCCMTLDRSSVTNGLSALKAINGTAKLTHSKVFLKDSLEGYGNSQDTSTVSCDFGVSIYTDPSGVFTNET